MIETILSWILTAVGEGSKPMRDYLFGLLDLSLSTIVSYFPFLVAAYQVLQACALGLILAIAEGIWLNFRWAACKRTRYSDTNTDSKWHRSRAGL